MPTELAEGAKAPAFNLPRDGGGSVSLADFKGRKLVLYFYPKADTPGCTREAIEFSKLRAEFPKAGTDVLGVSADPVAAQDKFKKKHSLGIALLSDETHKMLEAYGVWGKKSMYGRTFMGITRTTFLIGGGRADRPHLAQGQGRRPRRRGAGRRPSCFHAERDSARCDHRCVPHASPGFGTRHLWKINHNWRELARLALG